VAGVDVVHHLHRPGEVERLAHGSDARGMSSAGSASEPGWIVTEYFDATANVGSIEQHPSVDEVDECRLAGAARPDDGNALVRADRHRHAVERDVTARVANGDVLQADDGSSGR
jgi:hypothetical protein